MNSQNRNPKFLLFGTTERKTSPKNQTPLHYKDLLAEVEESSILGHEVFPLSTEILFDLPTFPDIFLQNAAVLSENHFYP